MVGNNDLCSKTYTTTFTILREWPHKRNTRVLIPLEIKIQNGFTSTIVEQRA